MLLKLTFLLNILIKLSASMECGNCNQNDCVYYVGILKVPTEKERAVINLVANFVTDKKILESNKRIRILFYPTDADNAKISDSTGWGLVGPTGDEILQSNISALLGSDTSFTVMKIHPFAILKDIPHFAPLATSTDFNDEFQFPHLIRMVPPEDVQIKVLTDVIAYHRHTHYSVIYSNTKHSQEQFRLLWLQSKKNNLELISEQLITTNDANGSRILNEIAKHQPHAVVLLCDAKAAIEYISKAHNFSMTSSDGWIWLVTDTISSTDFSPDKIDGNSRSFDGIIGVRPTTTISTLTDDFRQYLKSNSVEEEHFDYSAQKYGDSLLAMASGINRLCSTISQQNRSTINASILRENILAIKTPGFASTISFDETGKTLSLTFNIMQSLNSKWELVGTWNNSQLSISDKMQANLSSSPDVKFHINVATIVERPFVHFPTHLEQSDDPTELEGYCIAVLNELSKRIGFDYTLKLVSDGQYGAYNDSTQSWNGIIGELESREAELAVGSITATKDRASAVKFLPAFLNVGLKFIYHKSVLKQQAEEYNPFAFLFPFNISLYGAIIISVVLLAAFLSLFSELSPNGIRGSFFLSQKADQLQKNQITKLSRRARRQLQEDRKDAERGMGLNNALYFVWAALFWQSPERVPRSVSARVITVAWYLAAVVFLASYTANMVAVLSAQADLRLDSLTDLMIQTDLNYGTVNNSAVVSIMSQSDILLAKRLHHFLSQNQEKHIVSDFNKGMELVQEGRYSLLWDSISLDYAALQADCNMKTVDVGFGMVEYAFAMTKNSSHYNMISSTLIRMKEQGYMNQLYAQYFGELSLCGSGETNSNLPHQLSFRDLAGIFYLVGISMAVGIILLCGEWLMVVIYDVNKKDPKAPQTIKEAFNRRRNRLVDDFKRNWFPIETFNERWSHIALPAQHITEKMIERRLHQQPTHPFHVQLTTSKSSGNMENQ